MEQPTRSIRFLSLLAALIITIGSLIPQQVVLAQTDSSFPVNPVAVSEFFDPLIVKQLADDHIAGAAVTVVKDGEVILSKGYGFANLEKKVPIDPQETVFRLGSVSKLFTWTAVMQLAEQGKLDLDTDINQYLDFQIPATFPQPITMKQLMSHTAGFEDDNFETIVRKPADLQPMGNWLKTHLPARVRPPGKVLAYSNYGAQLAAYIVQRVSGLAFEDYIEQKIFEPLHMNNSSAHQLNPASPATVEATGYQYIQGSFQTVPYVYESCVGAEGINSTAADMARFILANLQQVSPILKPETARQMQSALLSYHPRINSFLYGFYEMNQNSLRILGHSGDHPGFHSILALVPDQQLGIFIAYNSEVPSVLQERTLAAFIDYFFPMRASTPQVSSAMQDAPRVAGLYRPTRSTYTSVEKVVYLLSSYSFRAQPDGSLVLNVGEPIKYVEVEPFVFQQVDGDDVFFFTKNEKGEIAYTVHNFPTISMYERYPWYENPNMHLILIGLSLLILISCLLAAGIRGVIRLFSRSKVRSPERPAARWADIGLLLSGVSTILFLVLLIMAVSDPQAIATGEAALARVALVFSTLVAISAPVLIFAMIWAWKHRVWKILRRVHFTLGILAVTALTFSFWVWNLIGWQF